MIIDIQTRIWSNLGQLGREVADRVRSSQLEHWGQFDGSPERHGLNTACVDASFVLGFRSELLGARIPNEYVAQFVAKAPERRFGVAGIDPMCDDAIDQIDAAVEMGLVAVTVSPDGQGFHPAHSSAMRVYERCVQSSLPVLVSSTTPLTPSAVLEFARPALWDEVARTFPTMPIVIGNMGNPWIDETLVLVGKHQNIFADIAGVASRPWQLYNALLTAAATGVMGKLLFASGSPYDTPEKTIESLYSVNSFSKGTTLPSIPRPQIRGIVERDTLSLIGIEAEIFPSSRPAESSQTSDAIEHIAESSIRAAGEDA